MNKQFYVGQEVVCINDEQLIGVKKGLVYVIKSLFLCRGCNDVTLTLVEVIDTGSHDSLCDCGHIDRGLCFSQEEFEPLDSLMKEEIKELMKVETIFGVKI